MKTDPYLLVP